jgi:hypothetical protein
MEAKANNGRVRPVIGRICFAASGLAAGMIQPLLLFISIEKLGQDKSFLQ